MGAWIGLNLIKLYKNRVKGFIGIGSAPEFLEKLMWNKFTKKIKKIIYNKKIIIISAIDNLIKGGGGQAVQNLNILFNFKKNMGLK